jgi:hypothetical protein
LFETRISFRPSACAAINVSNGPMGVPARSSFARTLAEEVASLELFSFLSFTLRGPAEVVRRPGEGLDVSFGPLVGRLQNERIPLAPDEHGIGIEAELLRQPNCLAPTCPEHLATATGFAS